MAHTTPTTHHSRRSGPMNKERHEKYYSCAHLYQLIALLLHWCFLVSRPPLPFRLPLSVGLHPLPFSFFPIALLEII